MQVGSNEQVIFLSKKSISRFSVISKLSITGCNIYLLGFTLPYAKNVIGFVNNAKLLKLILWDISVLDFTAEGFWINS